MPTHFTLRLVLFGAAEEAATVSDFEEWLHAFAITAALLSVTMADDIAAEEAEGTFLQLPLASTALLGVVLLDEAVEVGRQVDQIERVVGGK